ncbi:MAG TPA: hypothetical protein VEX41_11365, partial [Candidatus Eisenbacteria bacterium]|nr:hypothetical protein [Candidatus Eisenbacteria bacterium]
GLGPAIRRRCDLFVRIPMRGSIGSLNAAVAGSILLFEALGQRDPDAKPADGEGIAIRPPRRRGEPDRLEPAIEPEEAPAPAGVAPLTGDSTGDVPAAPKRTTSKRSKVISTAVPDTSDEGPDPTAGEPATPREVRSKRSKAPSEATAAPDVAPELAQEAVPDAKPAAAPDIEAVLPGEPPRRRRSSSHA